jgi:hypothetical protein
MPAADMLTSGSRDDMTSTGCADDDDDDEEDDNDDDADDTDVGDFAIRA